MLIWRRAVTEVTLSISHLPEDGIRIAEARPLAGARFCTLDGSKFITVAISPPQRRRRERLCQSL